MELRMKNFNIMVRKNQYTWGGGGVCLKRGAWTVFGFKGRGRACQRRGGVFEGGGGVDTPMHTMNSINICLHSL